MDRIERALLQTAKVWADASYCKRTKVGCVIAKDKRIIATGFNGTLPGGSNCCENDNFETIETVVHAEQNALTFCAKHGLTTKDCDMYSTVSPCLQCAKLIISAGIKRVVFIDFYRQPDGIELLKEYGVIVEQYGDNE